MQTETRRNAKCTYSSARKIRPLTYHTSISRRRSGVSKKYFLHMTDKRLAFIFPWKTAELGKTYFINNNYSKILIHIIFIHSFTFYTTFPMLGCGALGPETILVGTDARQRIIQGGAQYTSTFMKWTSTALH